jgi:signal recognition particle GTPase
MKSIIEFLRAIFNNPIIKNDLDAYIASGNPQSEQDVENLIKEFQQQRRFLTRNWND